LHIDRVGGRTTQNVLAGLGLILVSVSLVLFDGLASTGRSQAQARLDQYWRTSYDILVRPLQATPFVDAAGQRLVEPNFLSGQQGGITLDQYEQIKSIQGISVTAPIATVGHFPIGFLAFAEPVLYQPEAAWAVYKNVRRVTVHDGQRAFEAQDVTYTIHARQAAFGIDPQKGACLVQADGHKYYVRDLLQVGLDRPEHVRILGRDLCLDSSGKPVQHQFNAMVHLHLPVVGIDPDQEQALVGLADAVTEGRYLMPRDQPQLKPRHGRATSAAGECTAQPGSVRAGRSSI
jgi:hypothetical protein